MMRVLLSGIVCCLCVCLATVHADTITVVADEWCPYNCDPASDEPGFMIEIAKEVFRQAGHTLAYSIMDWDAAIEAARKGEYNAIVGAYKGDAPDFVFPDESLGTCETGLFVKQGDPWRFTGTNSLAGKKLGIIEGYSYDSMDEYLAAHKDQTVSFKTLEDMLAALSAGTVDVALEDPNVLSLFTMRNFLDNAFVSAGSFGEGPAPVYIAFSPANPKSADYAKILTDGIRAMRASGALADVMKKYGLK